jgi:hypothetical protein
VSNRKSEGGVECALVFSRRSRREKRARSAVTQGHKNWLCDISSLNDRVGAVAAERKRVVGDPFDGGKRCGSKLVTVESR